MRVERGEPAHEPGALLDADETERRIQEEVYGPARSNMEALLERRELEDELKRLEDKDEILYRYLARVLVEGSVYVPGTGIRTIPAILIYTEGPRAKVTGKWRDYVKDGHLYLEAELDVEQAGLFTLMAQVFGPQMEPLAWVMRTPGASLSMTGVSGWVNVTGAPLIGSRTGSTAIEYCAFCDSA